MSLAVEAGRQAKTHGLGDAVGAVIADGTSPDSDSLIIVAGDARWCHSATGCEGSGNVMGHAVMRVIGMVAQKRLRSAPESQHLPSKNGEDTGPTAPQNKEATTLNTFLEQPLTPIEDTYYRQSSISSDGYLCVGLDIYTTHEPCIMCSMAVLHSRFRGIIFGRRMVRTGGLTAEVADQTPWRDDFPAKLRDDGPQDPLHSKLNGLGYGMFWRDELNWKLLAWQWKEQGQSSIPEVHQNTHA
jgi:tRNA-specific adenosine deaminase 3